MIRNIVVFSVSSPALVAHVQCLGQFVCDRGSVPDVNCNTQQVKPVLQSCTVAKSEHFWRATGQSNLAYKRLAAKQKLPKFDFCTHTSALWPVEQSSILSAKFDCAVDCQKFSLLATAHDCEASLFKKPFIISFNSAEDNELFMAWTDYRSFSPDVIKI